MRLDIGHAYIVADRLGRDLAELIEPLLDEVVLFDVHDNFGARSGAQRAGGIEPMRLDLHLAPGAGSVPWATIAPLLAPHPAPLVLEGIRVSARFRGRSPSWCASSSASDGGWVREPPRSSRARHVIDGAVRGDPVWTSGQ